MKSVRRCAVILTAFLALDVTAFAQDFPFDHVLNMDVAPMRPNKRKPSLTIAADGSATLDLWCNSIQGRAEVSGEAITITPGDIPETPPAAISYGQCTPDRVQADQALRDALSQVSTWRRQGSAVVLSGPAPMRFFPSTN